MLIPIWSACDQIEGIFEGELPLLASQAAIQSLWQDGKITLWGTRRHHAKLEPIMEYHGLGIDWGNRRPSATPTILGVDYWEHVWENLHISSEDRDCVVTFILPAYEKLLIPGNILQRLKSGEPARSVFGQDVIAAIGREPSYETEPLGRAQDFHDGAALELIEHLFREGLLRVSGLRSDNGERTCIEHPRDWEIEWPGAKPRGDYDSEAYAKRPFEWGQHDHPYLYKDLEISRSAWNALEALIQSSPHNDIAQAASDKTIVSRARYTGNLAKHLKFLHQKGTLPDNDVEVEKEFRLWYEPQIPKNNWQSLPKRRAVISQITRIRRQLASSDPGVNRRTTNNGN